MNQSLKTLSASLAALLTCSVLSQAAPKGKPGGSGGGGTPPGNPAIVYLGDWDGNPAWSSLKVMDADGQNQRVLLQQSGRSQIMDPTWHPNGQTTIFTYTPNSGTKGRGIYRINLDGTGFAAIVPPPPTEGYYHALEQCDVSPLPGAHGKYRIAFRHRWPDNKGIFVIDEDGTGEVVQVAPPGSSSPSWSPDGRYLAYVRGAQEPPSNEFPNGRQLYYIQLVTLSEDASGRISPLGAVLLLSSESFGNIFGEISFSKTHNKIYFSAGTDPANVRLWALHLDNAMNPTGVQLIADAHAVRISAYPDDSAVVFGSYPGGEPVIFTVPSDGSSEPAAVAVNAVHPSLRR